MKIEVTAATLCELCSPAFSLEGCEAIMQYFEEADFEHFVPSIGDIIVSFSEVPADWKDEYDEETIIAILKNGNMIVAN